MCRLLWQFVTLSSQSLCGSKSQRFTSALQLTVVQNRCRIGLSHESHLVTWRFAASLTFTSLECSQSSHRRNHSEYHVYLWLGVSATLGSLLGNWARQFVNREVRCALPGYSITLRLRFAHFFFHFPIDVPLLQDTQFGLFWLIWAECALLSHVFRYDSISSMPLVPFLYVVLTPVLILSALLSYFYPSHMKNLFISQ